VNPVQSDAGGYYGADTQTQVRLLQSRALNERARKKVEAQPRPDRLQPADRLGLWRKTLGVSPPSDDQIWQQAIGMAAGTVRARGSDTTRIVEVTCDSTHPRVAADFCNTLTTEYIDQNLESRWKTTERTGEWLTGQLQDLKIKLETQQEELQHYVRSTALVVMGQGEETTDVNETRLADLQKELSGAQADRFAKQSKYEMASASTADALPDLLDDPTLKETQSSIAGLRAKLAQLSVTFTPVHAEVKRVQAQIDALEQSLENVRRNVLIRIKQDFEAAQRRESLLSRAYQQQAGLVTGKAEEVAHFNLLKRDVEATRMLYDTLQQRLKEASIASALRANNIRVVDGALVPGSPYKPDIGQSIMFGLLFGAVLGVTFSVMRERADRTLQDPGDVSYYLGVPELGVVPIGETVDAPPPRRLKTAAALALQSGNGAELRPRGKLELISWDEKSSLMAESFRTTLTSILFSRAGGDRPRVIVLSSASPKEGKTTVVSNLGIALAEINQRVLVIDADMRRPRLHTVFDVGNQLGLSDLLLSKVPLTAESLRDACVPTTVTGMFVLPSGGSRRNVSSLLHSDRLPELLRVARESFDTVFIDTPPMVNIADGRVLGRLADGLIMIVRSGVTTRDAALLAKARFAEDGINLLGTILNGWNPKTPGYSYYRYYYAGYYHYYGDQNGKGGGADNGPDGPTGPPGRGRPPLADDVPSSTWRPGYVFRAQASGEDRA
jgi:capsular exopolysaccharide synthesis family protein